MSLRLLLLSTDPDAPSPCLHVDDDGRILERSWLAPANDGDATPFAPTATHTLLVVPGTGARALWLELPAHSPAQALAAARLLLEDEIAGDDDLHLAIAPGIGNTTRLVVMSARTQLQEWLARAAAMGLSADAVIPEQLLLPATEASAPVLVFDAGDRWLVRGDRLAFSVEPQLAAHILGDRPRIAVDESERDRLFALAALAPEIDLLQYDFAPASRQPPLTTRRRRLIWLAAAVLLSPLLLLIAEALRYEFAARGLESRAIDLARAALPASADAPDPLQALQRRVIEIQAPDEFASAIAALTAAIATARGSALQSLDYTRGQALQATLVHPTAAELDAIGAALTGSGWRLVTGASIAGPDGLRTKLSLEPEP